MTEDGPTHPGGFLGYVIADESRTRRLLMLLCPLIAVVIAVVVTLIVVVLHSPGVATAVGTAFGVPVSGLAARAWWRHHTSAARQEPPVPSVQP